MTVHTCTRFSLEPCEACEKEAARIIRQMVGQDHREDGYLSPAHKRYAEGEQERMLTR